MEFKNEDKLLNWVRQKRPENLTVAGTSSSRWDACSVGIDFISEPTTINSVTYFEFKSRRTNTCKYIRKDGTLYIEVSKVDALEKLGDAVLLNLLEDTDELYAIKISDIKTKGVRKEIKMNKTSTWGGGKVLKDVYEFSLKDCYKEQL